MNVQFEQRIMNFLCSWDLLMLNTGLTSCSDISSAHCMVTLHGSLTVKFAAREGSGRMSTCSSAGRSEKLHWRPNSLRFFVYTYTISILAKGKKSYKIFMIKCAFLTSCGGLKCIGYMFCFH